MDDSKRHAIPLASGFSSIEQVQYSQPSEEPITESQRSRVHQDCVSSAIRVLHISVKTISYHIFTKMCRHQKNHKFAPPPPPTPPPGPPPGGGAWGWVSLAAKAIRIVPVVCARIDPIDPN
jgi:hypothetical protein